MMEYVGVSYQIMSYQIIRN